MTGFECPRCHERFGSLVSFDQHQVVRHNTPHPVTCMRPEDAGLVRGRGGLWIRPLTDGDRARLAAMKAKQADGPPPQGDDHEQV